MSVFDRIYARNGWNGRESLSGPGSDPNATKPIAGILAKLVEEFGIRYVVNAGCGDDLWTPDLGIDYLGIDVVALAIARARLHHPDRAYRTLDIRDEIPRGAGLVVLRDVLQHLPLADGVRVVERIRESGAAWLLASTYIGLSTRHRPESLTGEIAPGGYWCPDLMLPAYGLGPPFLLYPDGYDYDAPGTIGDPAKWLGLWRISPSS